MKTTKQADMIKFLLHHFAHCIQFGGGTGDDIADRVTRAHITADGANLIVDLDATPDELDITTVQRFRIDVQDLGPFPYQPDEAG